MLSKILIFVKKNPYVRFFDALQESKVFTLLLTQTQSTSNLYLRFTLNKLCRVVRCTLDATFLVQNHSFCSVCDCNNKCTQLNAM